MLSSVTDNAVGRYTINFANAMGNTNYAVTTHVEDGGGYNDGRWLNHENSQSRTTSSYGLYCLHRRRPRRCDWIECSILWRLIMIYNRSKK